MYNILKIVIVYAFIAIPTIIVLRSIVRFKVNRRGLRSPLTFDERQKIAQGKTGRQLTSFVFAIILTVLGVLLPVIAGSSNLVDDNDNNLYLLVILGLVALIPLTPLTILVNIFWVYSYKTHIAEQEAFHLKQAAPLLYIEHILNYIVWIAYTIFGSMYVFSFI